MTAKVTVSVSGLLRDVSKSGQWVLTLQTLSHLIRKKAPPLYPEAAFVVLRSLETAQPSPPQHVVDATVAHVMKQMVDRGAAAATSPAPSSALTSSSSVLLQRYLDRATPQDVVATCKALVNLDLCHSVRDADVQFRSRPSLAGRAAAIATTLVERDGKAVEAGQVLCCAIQSAACPEDAKLISSSTAALCRSPKLTWHAAIDVLMSFARPTAAAIAAKADDESLQHLMLSFTRDAPSLSSALEHSKFLTRALHRAHSDKAICGLLRRCHNASNWVAAIAVFEEHATHVIRSPTTQLAYALALRRTDFARVALPKLRLEALGMEEVHDLRRSFGFTEVADVIAECLHHRALEPNVSLVRGIVDQALREGGHWQQALRTILSASRDANLVVPHSLFLRVFLAMPDVVVAADTIVSLVYQRRAVEQKSLALAVRTFVKQRFAEAPDVVAMALVRCASIIPSVGDFLGLPCEGPETQATLMKAFERAIKLDLPASVAAIVHLQCADVLQCKPLLVAAARAFRRSLPAYDGHRSQLVLHSVSMLKLDSSNATSRHRPLEKELLEVVLELAYIGGGVHHAGLSRATVSLCGVEAAAHLDHAMDVTQALLSLAAASWMPSQGDADVITAHIVKLASSGTVAWLLFRASLKSQEYSVPLAAYLNEAWQPWWWLLTQDDYRRGEMGAAARLLHAQKLLDSAPSDAALLADGVQAPLPAASSAALVSVAVDLQSRQLMTWESALGVFVKAGLFGGHVRGGAALSEEAFSQSCEALLAPLPWEVALRCVGRRWETDGFPTDAAVLAVLKRDATPREVRDHVAKLYVSESLMPHPDVLDLLSAQ